MHARAGALESLLCAAGVFDRRGRRRRGWSVVQLGDLLDRHAAPEANLDTARLAGEAVDIVLAGNHESLLLADAAAPHGHALATLAAHGWPHAAAAFGDWLVTHAGVHPDLAPDLPARAHECAEEINHRWHSRTCGRGDPLFHAVGPSRGGPAAFGGILWLHADECPSKAAAPWGQITGHVPQREPTLRPRSWWAIDLGGRRGRLAALVRIGGEQRWRPIIVREHECAVLRLRRAVAA